MSAKYDPTCPECGRADNNGLLYLLEDLEWAPRPNQHAPERLVARPGALPVVEFTHPVLEAHHKASVR